MTRPCALIARGRVIRYTLHMLTQTYVDIITKFMPCHLQIDNLSSIISAFKRTNFLIYGEIHGAQENASVVYTIVQDLNIRRIAIENDPTVKQFIDSGVKGLFNFALIDPSIFDTSILSIEMAKTIAELIKNGCVDEITYIDTYFTDDHDWDNDDSTSPQEREQSLANNILSLSDSIPTICLLGQWHTQPKPVTRYDRSGIEIGKHLSALYRCRLVKPNIAFIHSVYHKGSIYNDGRILSLPVKYEVSQQYKLHKVTKIDFDLRIPFAHPISLPN